MVPEYVRKLIANQCKIADQRLPANVDRSSYYEQIADREISRWELKQASRSDSALTDGPLQHFFLVSDDDPADNAPHYRGRYVGH